MPGQPKKHQLPKIPSRHLKAILWGDAYEKGPGNRLITESAELLARVKLVEERKLFAIAPHPDYGLKKVGRMIEEQIGKNDLVSIRGIWCTKDLETALKIGKAYRGKVLQQPPKPLVTIRSWECFSRKYKATCNAWAFFLFQA